ncbi:ABC transporter permease [Ornithinibacillus sp. BX22]|uniref:Putative hemin transport system permease protein HrtB n=2 Tax=Bacillaceae TaxID=186817 RepID=A0A923L973_9BACI|nr:MULTISPECIES: ABC transporter permease [Bacillaceae]MBC5638681.1 ABC transporter permease [Ornithinibacillus hominis]TXL64061.1 ABC transporter permease [Cerasibacillus terrae]
MFLALREFKHAKLRFIMIGMILVLISWLVFILSGLGNGLSALSAATFKNMDADYVIFEEGSRHSMLRSVISEDLSKDLKRLEHVNEAAPMGSQTAVVLRENATSEDEKIDVSLLGINPGTFLEPEVIEGEKLVQGNDQEVIVNDVLKNQGIDLGDTLEIEGTDEIIKVVGFVENESFNHLPAIFMTMDAWRKIHFAAPGSDMGVINPVNAIMLQGEDIILEDINQSVEGIETATKQEAINGIPGYTAENGTIMMMLGFLLAISAFVITVFFYVMTLQKTNQFGILKAIGAGNGFLGRAVVSQVFLLAVISIGVGILLTYGTAMILPEGMPFALDPKLVISYAIVLLVVSVLSSLLSVRKITKIDPLQAIGRVE